MSIVKKVALCIFLFALFTSTLSASFAANTTAEEIFVHIEKPELLVGKIISFGHLNSEIGSSQYSYPVIGMENHLDLNTQKVILYVPYGVRCGDALVSHIQYTTDMRAEFWEVITYVSNNKENKHRLIRPTFH